LRWLLGSRVLPCSCQASPNFILDLVWVKSLPTLLPPRLETGQGLRTQTRPNYLCPPSISTLTPLGVQKIQGSRYRYQYSNSVLDSLKDLISVIHLSDSKPSASSPNLPTSPNEVAVVPSCLILPFPLSLFPSCLHIPPHT
jgi:hypothetical protein